MAAECRPAWVTLWDTGSKRPNGNKSRPEYIPSAFWALWFGSLLCKFSSYSQESDMKDSSEDSGTRNFYLINNHSVYSLNYFKAEAGMLFPPKKKVITLDYTKFKMFSRYESLIFCPNSFIHVHFVSYPPPPPGPLFHVMYCSAACCNADQSIKSCASY